MLQFNAFSIWFIPVLKIYFISHVIWTIQKRLPISWLKTWALAYVLDDKNHTTSKIKGTTTKNRKQRNIYTNRDGWRQRKKKREEFLKNFVIRHGRCLFPSINTISTNKQMSKEQSAAKGILELESTLILFMFVELSSPSSNIRHSHNSSV